MTNTQSSFSSKLPGIKKSIFSEMSALANEHQAINLSQGFPDFNCPDELIDRVTHYMKEGYNQYPPMPGVYSLKEKIAEKVKALYGTEYDPDKEITITAGATQGLHCAISTLVREHDEVIIIEPAYDAYLPSILLNKGTPKYLQLDPPDFKINWDQVKKLITYRTRAILINTPHNPSGMVMGKNDMEQLEKIAANYDIFIISDEVYEHMVFDGNEHQSICRYPNIRQNAFGVFSFGKTYHTTGWKIGYVLAPEHLTQEFRKVFQYVMFGVSTPMQYAYADYLEYKDHYLDLNDFYQAKRDYFRELIKDSRFKILPADGTYFQCVDFSHISDESDVDFCKRLITEYGVAAVPLSVFYHEGIDNQIIRFCFAKQESTLKKAGDILCKI